MTIPPTALGGPVLSSSPQSQYVWLSAATMAGCGVAVEQAGCPGKSHRQTLSGLMSIHTPLAVVLSPGSPMRCRQGGGGMEGFSSVGRPLLAQDRLG